MRGLIPIVLAGLTLATPAGASTVVDGPELAVRFFNTIPDVCFQTSRGHPPTVENATSLLLEPATTVPQTVKTHFGKVTSWFRLKSQPDNVFVGIGDRPNACHVVLANTTQTVEVQNRVMGFLKVGGFQIIKANSTPDSDTDMLFVKKAPDGYMLISLQAPKNTLHGGVGDQGAVHVNLMPTALFEAMLSKR
jgi:hypothetical protein